MRDISAVHLLFKRSSCRSSFSIVIVIMPREDFERMVEQLNTMKIPLMSTANKTATHANLASISQSCSHFLILLLRLLEEFRKNKKWCLTFHHISRPGVKQKQNKYTPLTQR